MSHDKNNDNRYNICPDQSHGKDYNMAMLIATTVDQVISYV